MSKNSRTRRLSYIGTTDPNSKSHFYIPKNKNLYFNRLGYKYIQIIKNIFQQQH